MTVSGPEAAQPVYVSYDQQAPPGYSQPGIPQQAPMYAPPPIHSGYSGTEGSPTSLIFSTPTYKDKWFRFLVYIFYPITMISCTAFMLAMCFITPDAWATFSFVLAVFIISAVIIIFVTPTRMEIWTSELRIKFLSGLTWHVALSTISNVEEVVRCSSGFGFAVKIGTAYSNIVKIERMGHWKVFLTPKDMHGFIDNLRSAVTAAGNPIYSQNV